MNKYVDADALLDKLPDDLQYKGSVRRVLIQAPAADVKPVIHGHWIDTGSGQECSVCHEFQPGYDNYRFYCAACGADMKGGE